MHGRSLSAAAWAASALALAAATPVAAERPAARDSAWCSSVPRVEVQPQQWGFHAGQPYPGATGTYARGHGDIDLAAGTATGVICQVDRVRGAGDRQVILSIVRRVLHTSHHAVMFGVEGNIMRIHVRVASSTDAGCAVGTTGEVTIFASYNGVKEDLVRFVFPAACRHHDHRYTGASVVTNVPPN